MTDLKRGREDDDGDTSCDDDSGENLMENVESDYAPIPELDAYDYTMLDRQQYESIDIVARRNAEV